MDKPNLRGTEFFATQKHPRGFTTYSWTFSFWKN